jgi:hypothetical protein
MSHLRQAVERLKRTAGAGGVTRIVIANEGESSDEALAASSVKPGPNDTVLFVSTGINRRQA